MANPSGQPDGSNDSIKETIESIVIAFILAFVFRAYVVEAFVIPTGSMAPTLLGEHVRVSCDQCGYEFTTDPAEGQRTERVRANRGGMVGEAVIRRSYITENNVAAVCPMCHYPNALNRGYRVSTGDRILVLKYLYSIREPQRWDSVVFKNPTKPDENYIKRLIGLPEEELIIVEGNIYTRPLGADRAAFNIQRKSDRPEVQRAVWQPIYHSDYVPLDGGDPQDALAGLRTVPWKIPWEPTAGDWAVHGRSYSYQPALNDPQDIGRIAFDFRAQMGVATQYAYNQLKRGDVSGFAGEPVEDVRIAATFQPAAAGLSVIMQTQARWDELDGGQPVDLRAVIGADGRASIEAVVADGTRHELAAGDLGAFAPGKAVKLEFWYVDQQASLWVAGKRVLQAEFEILSLDRATSRLLTRSPLPVGYKPRITIQVAGAPVSLHHIEVDRDLYYSSSQGLDGTPGTGAMVKHGRAPRGSAVTLSADQFFCLGDNSPLSSDGRYWHTVNDWVRYTNFENPDDLSGIVGRVPRDLMMGRAFFVYWPAMHGVHGDSYTVLPNFGQMRMIR